MPAIDLSILNQRQTPAFYADVFANRPAAGFVGRIFVSTNTFAFYRDNGTSWDLIGGPGTGTVTGTGANGQVTFWNGASTITGSNDLFWDATNGHLGVNTNVPGTALDVHHDQPTVAILNQTVATNDTRIGFQNNGVGLWRIGSFYSGGSNDFKVNDAVLNINRFTIKSSSGQTFVGDEVTSSGLFVVNNSSSDAHIVALGATAPSIRVRNAGTGASLQFGLGLATTTNNFIQGATGGEFCIFNDSLTAQPILFGIKDAGLGNTQEAARISASRNFLIGTTTDAGQKLQVNGTSKFYDSLILNRASGGNSTGIALQTGSTNNWFIGSSAVGANTDLQFYNHSAAAVVFNIANTTGAATFSSTASATSLRSSAVGTFGFNTANNGEFQIYATAADGMLLAGRGSTNDLTLLNKSGQDVFRIPTGSINPYFLGNLGIGVAPSTGGLSGYNLFEMGSGTGGMSIYSGTNQTLLGTNISWSAGTATYKISNFAEMYNQQSGLHQWYTSGTTGTAGNPITFIEVMRTTNSANLLIGTTTDNGQKLQVNGNASVNGTVIAGDFLSASGTVSNPFAVWTTMFTIAANQTAIYQLIAVSPGNGLTYTASATIVVNSAAIELRNYVPGGALILQVSGYDIQCQNGSGSTLAIQFKYIRIS